MIESLKNSKLAKAIAFRLTEFKLRIKHSGWFMFAHKPLCSHYQHDIFNLNGIYVCRSCTLVYTAIACSVIFGAAFPQLTLQYQLALPIIILLLTGLSYPPLYKSHNRFIRDLLRTSLGLSIGFATILILLGSYTISLVSLAFLISLWFVFGQLRQKTKRFKCETCPELHASGICSGYQRQANSLQSYEQAVEENLRQNIQQPPKIITEKTTDN
jgi:hypothetical protein